MLTKRYRYRTIWW